MSKNNSFITAILGTCLTFVGTSLDEHDLATKPEAKTPTTLKVPPSKEKTVVEVMPQQPQKEVVSPITAKNKRKEQELDNIFSPILYSILTPEDTPDLTLSSRSEASPSQITFDIPELVNEIGRNEECSDINALFADACTPFPKQKRLFLPPLFSIGDRENRASYQAGCGSLLGDLDRHSEESGLNEQCLGGFDIIGKNWKLELRTSMTYHFDPKSEKVEIKPCPDGDLTECTTVGIGLTIKIP